MQVVEESVQIRAPNAAVFQAIIDPRRGGEWNPNVVGISDFSGYPVVKGSTWIQTVMIMGRPVDLRCEVTELDAPKLGVLNVTGGQQGRITTRCSERDGITLLRQRLEFVPPGGLAGGMLARLAGPMIGRELAGSLERLRVAVERESGGNRGSESA